MQRPCGWMNHSPPVNKRKTGLSEPRGQGVNRAQGSAKWREHTGIGQAVKDFVFLLKKWEGPRGFKHRTDILFYGVHCGFKVGK